MNVFHFILFVIALCFSGALIGGTVGKMELQNL